MYILYSSCPVATVTVGFVPIDLPLGLAERTFLLRLLDLGAVNVNMGPHNPPTVNYKVLAMKFSHKDS